MGDSLNRNMWESLVCILRHSVSNKKRVFEVMGRKKFKTKGYYSFRFEVPTYSFHYCSRPSLEHDYNLGFSIHVSMNFNVGL